MWPDLFVGSEGFEWLVLFERFAWFGGIERPARLVRFVWSGRFVWLQRFQRFEWFVCFARF